MESVWLLEKVQHAVAKYCS